MIVAEGRNPDMGAQSRQTLLQWGRNLIVAEGEIPGMGIKSNEVLQWGRNLIVAEGFDPEPSGLW